MPFPCHAVPLRVYNVSFPFYLRTQCGLVWLAPAVPRPCHALTMPFFSRPRHSMVVSRRPCCAVVLRRTAWSEHGMGMASVNQTRPHCVNQMGKTRSKPLAARHDRGTAWARHAMCESAFSVTMSYVSFILQSSGLFLIIHLLAYRTTGYSNNK